MSDKFVQVNPDSTGKKIRTEEVVIGPDTVEQQTVTLAKSDGTLLDSQLGNLDLALTALRDAITGIGGAAKNLADVVTAIQATQNVNVTNASLAVTNAGLTNIDVALSTRTKPADQQHTIIDSGTTAVTGTDGSLARNIRLASDGRMQLADGDVIVRELTMIRQGIGLLLSEFSGRGVDLTTLNELEAI